MAVDLKKTFYGWTDQYQIAAGETITEEGCVLARKFEDGIEKCKVATGASGETVIGFALFRQLTFGTNAIVETHVIPATSPYTVDLGHANLVTTPANQLRVTNAVGGAVITPASVNYGTGVITFNAGDAGKTVYVAYRWNMTVAEAQTTFYNAAANYPDPNFFGQMGVGKGKGRLFTLHYDASKLYDDTVTLSVAAGGLISTGGSITIPARVIQAPSANDPFLGIEFLI